MIIKLLLATPDPIHAQTIAVPIYLYDDLACQDLAPEFEDRHETFGEGSGYFMQLLAWDTAQLQMDVRRRCLASACALHTLARPMPLLARRTNAVLTVKNLHWCHRDRRGSPVHLSLLFLMDH